jgi:hypothetical protein
MTDSAPLTSQRTVLNTVYMQLYRQVGNNDWRFKQNGGYPPCKNITQNTMLWKFKIQEEKVICMYGNVKTCI